MQFIILFHSFLSSFNEKCLNLFCEYPQHKKILNWLGATAHQFENLVSWNFTAGNLLDPINMWIDQLSPLGYERASLGGVILRDRVYYSSEYALETVRSLLCRRILSEEGVPRYTILRDRWYLTAQCKGEQRREPHSLLVSSVKENTTLRTQRFPTDQSRTVGSFACWHNSSPCSDFLDRKENNKNHCLNSVFLKSQFVFSAKQKESTE